MFLKRLGKVLALFKLLLIAGCSSTGGTSSLFPSAGGAPIKIESEPAGAEVYVIGKKIGVTPLEISQKDVFPNIYPREMESAYGKVILKKEGCLDFTRTVSPEIINAGLRARLNCGDLSSPSSKTFGDASHSSKTSEQRLEEIKDFLSKGLITEEEAKKARARILNDL